MKDYGGLAHTRPGVLASIPSDQLILRFQRLLNQPHIIFFRERIKREHRTKNGSGFDANQGRPVDAARNR
jgi:hypothetical protein